MYGIGVMWCGFTAQFGLSVNWKLKKFKNSFTDSSSGGLLEKRIPLL
jgi:hypothetical protein